VIALALALGMAAPCPSPSASPAAPSVSLIIWPDGQRIWQGGTLYTGARVRVDDPQRELGCPEIQVDWGDGSKSRAQSAFAGCDPFALTSPDFYRFTPKVHAYRWPGEFLVVACIVNVKGECVKELRATRLVSIKDPDETRRRALGGYR
jgi:hypothetical protein